MKENVRMCYPSYFKEFKCVGGNCEDNCCNEWEINIDKNTFEMYEKIQDRKMNKYVNNNIFIKKKHKDFDIDYGQIKLKHNDKCPFLNKQKYCIIQAQLGKEYLSNVCTTFPRIINKVDNHYEVSLDVSCIEAARILLLKEEGIQFEESESILGKYELSARLNTESSETKDTNLKYMKEIRSKSIKFMQNRKYEISERLYMLGVFLETTRKELCYNYNNAMKLINKFDCNYLGGNFNRNNENYLLQLSFFREMLDSLGVYKGNYSSYFKEKIEEAISGFRFNKRESLIENSEACLKAYIKCEKNIFQKYSYIFENYLVNHMFKELFPFSESDVIINDYIMMLVRFAYIRFFIVGQYLYRGELSKIEIVRSIQSLSKEIEHSKSYLKDILKYIKENELDNMRFAKILL